MLKQFLIVIVAVGAFAGIARGQALKDICMTAMMDSIVKAVGMSDSITIAGDCDSAVALMGSGFIKIPVAKIVKKDSCHVSASIVGLLDTVFNYCELPILRGFISYSPSALDVSYSGTRLQVGGASLPEGNIVVRLFSESGRCVGTLTAENRSAASWTLEPRAGAMICTVAVNGKILAIRRVSALR